MEEPVTSSIISFIGMIPWARLIHNLGSFDYPFHCHDSLGYAGKLEGWKGEEGVAEGETFTVHRIIFDPRCVMDHDSVAFSS